MSALLQRLLSALTHPLAEPVGSGLTNLKPGALGGLMPGKSLLHGLNHLHPRLMQVGLFHDHCSTFSHRVIFVVLQSSQPRNTLADRDRDDGYH